MNNFFFDRFMKQIRSNIFAGLLLIIPLAGSLLIIIKLFNWADSFLPDLIHTKWFPGVGLLVGLISVYLLGVLAKNWFGRKIISSGNSVIVRIPFLNKIYLVLKQIIDTVTMDKKKVFDRAVMIEFPRKECYTLGLVTSEKNESFSVSLGRKVVAVFIPNAPNLTAGFLQYVPEEDVITLDIPVETALKLVMSCGILSTEKSPLETATPASSNHWNWLDIFGKKPKNVTGLFDPRD